MENSIKYIMIKLRKGFSCKKIPVAFLLLFLFKKNSKGCCCVNRKFHSLNRKNTLCGKWTLLRPCRGMDVDLSTELMGISRALESRIITSWIHLFSRQVSFLVTWPTMEPIKSQSCILKIFKTFASKFYHWHMKCCFAGTRKTQLRKGQER